nr:uncharacterized protein Dmel_CG15446, isoform C [Drosophila melanogaster]AFH07502.1 uncharacterized protein Dmel_CG15446, isoform C [Drosophila melanogaster]|eukprot:NP_001245790.1 uncharacterized protein Dmel_CG15446, isoform C [Drosophila melanogaster]
MANQSRRQLENDSWLSSDRLPMMVRHEIETRNKKQLMSKYNAETATHVFSHNGGPRRGRPPSAATAARMASEFARQVGGISQSPTIEDEGKSGEQSVMQPKSKKANKMPDKVADKLATKSEPKSEESNVPVKIKVEGVEHNAEGSQSDSMVNTNQGFTTNRNFIPILSSFPNPYRNMDVTWTEQFNALSNQYYNHIMNSISSLSQIQPLNSTPSANPPIFGANPMVMGRHPPFSVFSCPLDYCKENFDSRRAMYKHQRETGHHNWPHNCSKCGQVFRTSGFMRMHSVNACARNLHKFKITKPNELQQLGKKPKPE